MLFYLIIISISGLFAFCAQQCRPIKLLFYLFSALAVFIPAFFAGCRDLDVGYDVSYYGYGIFIEACASNSFWEFFTFRYPTNELFYLFINYVAANICPDFHFALGCISFVTVFFLYCASVRLRDDAPMWLIFVAFMLLLFPSSMNLLRQSVAVSVALYAYSVMRTSGLSFLFWVVAIVAMLSHTTAFLVIAAYVCYYMARRMDEKAFKKFFAFMVIGALVLFFGLAQVLMILEGITGKGYTTYMDTEQGAGWAKSIVPATYILVLMCFIMACVRSWVIGRNIPMPDLHEYKCNIVIVSLCMILGATFTGSLLRLVSYFLPLCLVSICTVLFDKRENPMLLTLFQLFAVCLFVVAGLKSFDSGCEYSSEFLLISK